MSPTLISNETYYPTIQAFNQLCMKDRTITAAAQLIYRLIIDECNRSRWNDGFICPVDQLEAITHMSRPTIIDARMRLKSRGLIHFEGKPSRYTVYSLVNHDVNQNPPPTPPGLKPQNKIKKKGKGKKK